MTDQTVLKVAERICTGAGYKWPCSEAVNSWWIELAEHAINATAEVEQAMTIPPIPNVLVSARNRAMRQSPPNAETGTTGKEPQASVERHTAGPWWVDRDDDDEVLDISSNSRAGFIPIATLKFGYDGPVESEQHANAALIAAAPKMHALLRELIDIEGPQPGTSEWSQKVKACLHAIEGSE